MVIPCLLGSPFFELARPGSKEYKILLFDRVDQEISDARQHEKGRRDNGQEDRGKQNCFVVQQAP
jgi:hypothetical protein